MPDKKRKFETKVHRKTLNPFFNETFAFKNVSIFTIFQQYRLHFREYSGLEDHLDEKITLSKGN